MEEEDKGYRKALDLGFFYLRFRPRSEKEMRDYLLKKGETFDFGEPEIDRAMERLKELKFIGDPAFVAWYVEQRSKAKPKGVYALKRELGMKGIARETIDTYFGNTEIDEERSADEVLRRKWRTYTGLDPKKRFERAAGFLMRRGFSFDVAKKTIARIEHGE
jgi:regulatory protein